MVREMIDEEGADAGGVGAPVKESPSARAEQDADANLPPRRPQQQQRSPPRGAETEELQQERKGEDKPGTPPGGKVVSSTGARGGGTAYVGATHFMAMLDDVGFVDICISFPPLNNACPQFHHTHHHVRLVRAGCKGTKQS